MFLLHQLLAHLILFLIDHVFVEVVQNSDDDDDSDDEDYVDDSDDEDDDDFDEVEDVMKELISDDDDDDDDDDENSDEEVIQLKVKRKKVKKPKSKNANETEGMKRARKEDVMSLLQKTHAGSLFQANDLPTWDEEEGDSPTHEPPTKKAAVSSLSPMHWTKQAIMRERHHLIAHSAPKALRPSKWDQEYDAPKLPKIRTGVVKAEDVSQKFDQFLTKAAGKKEQSRAVDDDVRSNLPITSRFKSDWSKKMQQKQSPSKKHTPGKPFFGKITLPQSGLPKLF